MYRILFSFLFSTVATAATVNLEWDAVSDARVGWYEIGYGSASNGYTQYVDVEATETQGSIEVPEDGQTFIGVRALAANRDPAFTSPWSNEIVYGDLAAPTQPSNQFGVWAYFESTDPEEPPMAEVIRYVDPDAAGSGDGTSWADAYTSLAAWNAGEVTDLVTDGDWHHVYVRSSAGTADTINAIIGNDWVTSAANYIYIEAADGDRAVKTGWDVTRYRLIGTGKNTLIIETPYTTIDGLQVGIDNTANATFTHAIYVESFVSSGPAHIKNCYLYATGATDGSVFPVEWDDPNASGSITNTILFNDCAVAADGKQLFIDQTAGLDIYNSVVYGNNSGDAIDRDEGPVTVINTASFNNIDDFDGTFTSIDHCASNDGDGTNSVSPSGSDWANEFTDPANGNFTLRNSGNLYHGGTPITGGPVADIDGDAWNATAPSIGADEYSAGGAALPIILGGQQIESVHFGSTEVSEIHLGSTQLWP